MAPHIALSVRARFAYERLRPAISYSRVCISRTPSGVPSSSNFPACHWTSELGLIAPYQRFSCLPPWGLPQNFPTREPRPGVELGRGSGSPHWGWGQHACGLRLENTWNALEVPAVRSNENPAVSAVREGSRQAKGCVLIGGLQTPLRRLRLQQHTRHVYAL
jgi:hypothetical protein